MATEHTPSRNEEEYFARVDADLRKELRAKADAERAARIAVEQNKCPRDGAALVAKSYHHVVIDQCPQCHGVWLDNGELELLATHKNEPAGFFDSLLNKFRI